MMRMGKVLVGVVLVGFGALLLLDNLEVVAAGRALADWWPLILVVAGVLAMLGRPRNLPAAVLFGGVGLALLAVTTGLLEAGTLALLWPLLLIGIGLWIVFARRLPVPARGATPDETLDVLAFLSGRDIRSHAHPFRGGSIMALLGGVDLDLRGATLAPGAALNVTAALGGVTIIVPPGWEVVMEGSAILGGYENNTDHGGTPPEGAPRLDVRVQALLGGVEVRARAALPRQPSLT
jgi:hypothetical protein